MPVSQETVRLLARLAQLVVADESESLEDLSGEFFAYGSYSREISPRVEPDGDGAQARHVRISGEELALYRKLLRDLRAEPELEHLKDRQIRDEMWELISELFVRRERFRSGPARDERIAAFLAAVARPHEEYEVLFAVDGLRLVDAEVEIGGVRFFPLDEALARERYTDGTDRAAAFVRPLIGRTVGATRASGGTRKQAAERAKPAVDLALDALRVGAAQMPATMGQQLLMRRGQDYLVVRPTSPPKPPVGAGWELGHAPLELELDQRGVEAAAERLEAVRPLFDGSVPEPLRGSLLRALDWIGTSIAREDRDDQVLDLCTAMETLLVPEGRGEKARPMALRTLLLALATGEDRVVVHPTQVLLLYGRRSAVVHGSERGVCTKGDYLSLRRVALGTLTGILRLARRDPSIRSITDAVATIEAEEQLAAARDWLGEWTDDDTAHVRTCAEERLNAATAR